MLNADTLLKGLLGGNATGGSFGGGTIGESLIGGAAGKLLSGKRGRKNRKKLIKYGALAAVGALAFTAYKKYQDNQSGGASGAAGHSAGSFGGGNSPANMTGQPASSASASGFSLGTPSSASPSPAPSSTPNPGGASGQLGSSGVTQASGQAEDDLETHVPVEFMPADERQQAELSMILVRAMIAAACCDGYFDDAEKARVLARAQEAKLSPEDQAALEAEIQQPISIDALAQAASTPQVGMEIYMASRMAIDVDSETERRYLHKLSEKLALEPKLVRELDRQLDG